MKLVSLFTVATILICLPFLAFAEDDDTYQVSETNYFKTGPTDTINIEAPVARVVVQLASGPETKVVTVRYTRNSEMADSRRFMTASQVKVSKTKNPGVSVLFPFAASKDYAIPIELDSKPSEMTYAADNGTLTIRKRGDTAFWVEHRIELAEGALVRISGGVLKVEVAGGDGSLAVRGNYVELTCDRFHGFFGVDVQSGSVSGSKLTGKLMVDLQNGPVSWMQSRAAGTTINVGNGSISLEGWKVDTAEVQCKVQNGAISLKDVACRKLTADVQQGEVQLFAPFPASGTWSAKVQNGKIRMTGDGSTRCNLTALVRKGTFFNRVTGEETDRALTNWNWREGGWGLSLECGNGEIEILPGK